MNEWRRGSLRLLNNLLPTLWSSFSCNQEQTVIIIWCGGFSEWRRRIPLIGTVVYVVCVHVSAVVLTALLCANRRLLRWSLTLMTRTLQFLVRVRPFISLPTLPLTSWHTPRRSVWRKTLIRRCGTPSLEQTAEPCFDISLCSKSSWLQSPSNVRRANQTHKSRCNNLIRSGPSASCLSVLPTNGASSQVWC